MSDTSFIDRMLNERRELAEKVEKLGEFTFGNPKFVELTGFERLLMEQQLTFMRLYLKMLEQRIAFYNKG